MILDKSKSLLTLIRLLSLDYQDRHLEAETSHVDTPIAVRYVHGNTVSGERSCLTAHSRAGLAWEGW